MLLRIRHLLLVLAGGAWLLLSFLLLPRSLTNFELLTWLAALFVAMVLVDRAYVAWVRRRHGVDPTTLHWWQLRNRNGEFFCAACQSAFLLPPEDLSDEGMVHCGDCGHPIASYGEMMPLTFEQGQGQLESLGRRLR